MAKKTKEAREVTNAWTYVDWLYNSNRITAEEHSKLKGFLVDLEEDTRAATESYCYDGC